MEALSSSVTAAQDFHLVARECAKNFFKIGLAEPPEYAEPGHGMDKRVYY